MSLHATLLIVAFPELSQADRAWVEDLRARHHPRAGAIAAHFTLVYPTGSVSEELAVPDAQQHIGETEKFSFVLRHALPFPDDGGQFTDVFLVPDEGFSALARLSDRLYSGVFAPARRLDLPSIPHLTIARFRDAIEAAGFCDRLNREPFEIVGRITSIDVLRRDDGQIQSIARLPLKQ
jgi:hypothetical protein